MIKLDLTPGQAVILQNNLNHFKAKTLPFKVSLAIVRNLEKIESPCKKYIDELRSRYEAQGGEFGEEKFNAELMFKLDKELFAESNQVESFDFLALDFPENAEISATEIELVKQLLIT